MKTKTLTDGRTVLELASRSCYYRSREAAEKDANLGRNAGLSATVEPADLPGLYFVVIA